MTPARSITLSVGFVGVSTQTTFVSSRTAADTASRSRWSTIVYSTPKPVSTLSTSRYVPPYRSSGSTTWPAPTAVSTACSAAIPDEKADASPPSSSPSAVSNAARVGLAERE